MRQRLVILVFVGSALIARGLSTPHAEPTPSGEQSEAVLVSFAVAADHKGRGVFVTPDWWALTSRHVVERSGVIIVSRGSGLSGQTDRVQFFDSQDLALVQVVGQDFAPIHTPWAVLSVTGIQDRGTLLYQGQMATGVFMTSGAFLIFPWQVRAGMSGLPVWTSEGQVGGLVTASDLVSEQAYVLPVTGGILSIVGHY